MTRLKLSPILTVAILISIVAIFIVVVFFVRDGRVSLPIRLPTRPTIPRAADDPLPALRLQDREPMVQAVKLTTDTVGYTFKEEHKVWEFRDASQPESEIWIDQHPWTRENLFSFEHDDILSETDSFFGIYSQRDKYQYDPASRKLIFSGNIAAFEGLPHHVFYDRTEAISPDGEVKFVVVHGKAGQPLPPDSGYSYFENAKSGQRHSLEVATTGEREASAVKWAHPTWSPNGRFIALYDASRWNTQGIGLVLLPRTAKTLDEAIFLGNVEFVETERFGPPDIVWSPRGDALFAGDDQILFTIEPTVREIYRSSYQWGDALRWSPDGSRVLGVSDEGLFVVEIATGQQTLLVGAWRPPRILHADWAPDSRHIVYTSDSALYILDLERLRQQQVLQNDGGSEIKEVHWSQNGQWIIYLRDRTLWALEMARA